MTRKEPTLVEQAATFLEGQGQGAVRRYLRDHGLPLSLFDDLVQDVLVRVLTAQLRGVEPESVEAFTARLAQRAARDLIRGLLRRPEGHLVSAAEDDEDLLAAHVAPDDPADELVTADELARLAAHVDHVRRRLVVRLDQHQERAAGALAVLAIAHGDATPAEDCPRPAGGVAADEAIAWAGLFYGGAERCFPSPHDPEDAAMRKRRSRALTRQRDALRQAAVEAGDG